MVARGKLYSLAERKLERFKWRNQKMVEIIRITPEYYSNKQTPLVLRIFFGIMLLVPIGPLSFMAVVLGSDNEAPLVFKIIGLSLLVFGIMFFLVIEFVVFADIFLYPNMLQVLLVDKDKMIKWNCLLGISWSKSFGLKNLDYVVKKVLIDVDEHGVDSDFVIELHYGKDEYGRELIKRLWREDSTNKNVIDEVAKSLNDAGFEVKEPLASKFLGTLASFDR